MTHYDEVIAAREAHHTAQKALLGLAADAIREAFVASTEGLQLAMALTAMAGRAALRPALPLIAHDTRGGWLSNVLAGVDAALREFEAAQYDTPEERTSLASAMNAARDRIRAEMPKRCPRDENVVILQSVNSGVFYRAERKRIVATFVEYKLDSGAVAKVSKRGATEYAVVA
jgi:hypothetical protein